MVGTKFCDINKIISISIMGHLALKELWNVEDDSKEGDGDEIREQSTPVRGCISQNFVIVERVINRNVALSGNTNCHKDGPCHCNGVERIEDVREQ